MSLVKTMFLNDLKSEKTRPSKFLRLFGIVIAFTAVQPGNISFNVSIPSSNSIFFNFSQYQNIPSQSKFFTLLGILIEVSDLQWLKALSQIVFRVFGNSIFFSREQSANAKSPITSMPSGITTEDISLSYTPSTVFPSSLIFRFFFVFIVGILLFPPVFSYNFFNNRIIPNRVHQHYR